MKKLRYEFECKIHTDTPDFWLIVEDRLIDVKGDHFLEDGKLINPFDRTPDGLYAAKQKCMIENHVELILTGSTEFNEIRQQVISKHGDQLFSECE